MHVRELERSFTAPCHAASNAAPRARETCTLSCAPSPEVGRDSEAWSRRATQASDASITRSARKALCQRRHAQPSLSSGSCPLVDSPGNLQPLPTAADSQRSGVLAFALDVPPLPATISVARSISHPIATPSFSQHPLRSASPTFTAKTITHRQITTYSHQHGPTFCVNP